MGNRLNKSERYYIVEINEGIYLGHNDKPTKDISRAYKYNTTSSYEANQKANLYGGRTLYYLIEHYINE